MSGKSNELSKECIQEQIEWCERQILQALDKQSKHQKAARQYAKQGQQEMADDQRRLAREEAKYVRWAQRLKEKWVKIASYDC